MLIGKAKGSLENIYLEMSLKRGKGPEITSDAVELQSVKSNLTTTIFSTAFDNRINNMSHTHTRLTAHCPGLPR